MFGLRNKVAVVTGGAQGNSGMVQKMIYVE